MLRTRGDILLILNFNLVVLSHLQKPETFNSISHIVVILKVRDCNLVLSKAKNKFLNNL